MMSITNTRRTLTFTPEEQIQALERRLFHVETLNERLVTENDQQRHMLSQLLDRMEHLERRLAISEKTDLENVNTYNHHKDNDKDGDDDECIPGTPQNTNHNIRNDGDDKKEKDVPLPNGISADSMHGYLTILAEAGSSCLSEESPKNEKTTKEKKQSSTRKRDSQRVPSEFEHKRDSIQDIEEHATTVDDIVCTLAKHLPQQSILKTVWNTLKAGKRVSFGNVQNDACNGWCVLCVSRDVNHCYPIHVTGDSEKAPDGYVDITCLCLVQSLQHALKQASLNRDEDNKNDVLSIIREMPTFKPKRLKMLHNVG